MNNPRAWECYSGSQIEWKGEIEGLGQIHAWILPRQSYCDRGHWNWGIQGENMLLMEPEVAYYFMSEQTARSEIEELIFRSSTATPMPNNHLKANCDKNQWAQSGPQKFMKMFPSSEGAVLVSVEWDDCATGGMWVANCEGIKHLDCSDAFPRRYFLLDNALSEMDLFCQWRLNKVPHQDARAKLEEYEEKMSVPMMDDCAQLVCTHAKVDLSAKMAIG